MRGEQPVCPAVRAGGQRGNLLEIVEFERGAVDSGRTFSVDPSIVKMRGTSAGELG